MAMIRRGDTQHPQKALPTLLESSDGANPNPNNLSHDELQELKQKEAYRERKLNQYKSNARRRLNATEAPQNFNADGSPNSGGNGDGVDSEATMRRNKMIEQLEKYQMKEKERNAKRKSQMEMGGLPENLANTSGTGNPNSQQNNSNSNNAYLKSFHKVPLTVEQIIAIFEPEQIEELFECFQLFDSDGGGSIGFDELKTLFAAMGKEPSDKELEIMIAEVDEDESGEIEFPEFLNLMARKMQTADSEAELRQCFMLFDRDKSGSISASELKAVMNNLGENVSDSQVYEMISLADPGGDGELDVDDFIAFVKSKGMLK